MESQRSRENKKVSRFLWNIYPHRPSLERAVRSYNSRHKKHFYSKLFGSSIFLSHIILEIAKTFEYVLRDFGFHHQGQLVESLTNLWRTDNKSRSFESLKNSISIRKSDTILHVKKIIMMSAEQRDQYCINLDYIHLDVVQIINSSIDIFNNTVGNHNLNWAFLFDELELAPRNVVQNLIDSLRGSSSKVIYKLSIAPYSPDITMLKDIFAAMPGNDYDIISLWNSNKSRDVREFSKELITSMLNDRNITDIDISSIFQNPTLTPAAVSMRKAYEYDESFRRYIDNKYNSNLNSVLQSTGDFRKAHYNKIAKILQLRVETSKFIQDENFEDGYRKQKRSLKLPPQMYSGLDNLIEILEGNPRWIIGVISPLLDEYEKNKKKITSERQTREIIAAIEKFHTLLKTIPCPVTNNRGERISVESLIEKMGEYARSSVHGNFRPQPYGSFLVDRNTPIPLQDIIGAAINAGALVQIQQGSVLNDLSGQRLRLSYLIAPKHNLPLTLLEKTPLSNVLSRKKGAI